MMPYIDKDPTAPNHTFRGDRFIGLILCGVALTAGAWLIDHGDTPPTGSPDIMQISQPPPTTVAPTPTTTVPATTTTTVPGAPVGPTYETCEEDEILAPLTYGNPTHYVCVVADDFMDPASIARLDAILNERRNP